MAQQSVTIQSWEDKDHFISFSDAPGQWEKPSIQSNKHSCLLGEIIQADTFIRPRLVCRDVNSRQLVVAFYPDNEAEMPRLQSGFKVGHTIAIFYPVSHGFLDGSVGIRVETPDKVLIIPLQLNDVLAMNKEVIEFVNRDGTPRKCHGCGQTRDRFDKCGRCEMFYYCNRVKGWDTHKRYCRSLKDKNVKKMLLLDYTTIDNGAVSFH
ncbi:hypothetical protein F4825DRAFT_464445 [Nemania diffusa]|nr:hypothetical protein F4825DRAFT_464445 [Nemania diffusa]